MLYASYISNKTGEWQEEQKQHLKKTEVICQKNQYILKCL